MQSHTKLLLSAVWKPPVCESADCLCAVTIVMIFFLCPKVMLGKFLRRISSVKSKKSPPSTSCSVTRQEQRKQHYSYKKFIGLKPGYWRKTVKYKNIYSLTEQNVNSFRSDKRTSCLNNTLQIVRNF